MGPQTHWSTTVQLISCNQTEAEEKIHPNTQIPFLLHMIVILTHPYDLKLCFDFEG